MPLLYFFHLFEYSFFGISFADISIILFLLFLFVTNKRFYIKPSITFFFLTCLILTLLVSAFLNINENYFSAVHFTLAFFKFLIYSSMFLIMPLYLSNHFDKFILIIERSLCVIVFLGLYQMIAHFFFPFLYYDLSPSFLSARSGLEAMFSYGGRFRVKSIYTEPAHFGIYINILYFIIIKSGCKIKKTTHFIVFLGVSMSLSLSAIALYLANVLIQIVSASNFLRFIKTFALLIGCLSIFLLNGYVANRIFNIANLSEGSGVIRLLGSWEIALKSPTLSGVGLGNMETFGRELFNKHDFHFATRTEQVFNIFAVVLMVAGLPGLLLFIAFLFALAKGDLRVVFFVFTHCCPK